MGTVATFIFKLGGGSGASERFDQNRSSSNDVYQIAAPSYWPTWLRDTRT